MLNVTISMLGNDTRMVYLPLATIIVFDEPIGKIWCVVWFNDPSKLSAYITAPTQDQAIHHAFNLAERG